MNNSGNNIINPWKIRNKRSVYNNPWIHVEEHAVINPAGSPGIYGTVSFHNYAIGILPVDAFGNTWLIGQYRFPVEQYTWEIPEGGGNKKDDPLVHAKRELEEEAGLHAGKFSRFLEMQLSNSVTDEYAYIFLAEELTEVPPRPDADEVITIRKLPLREAYALLDTGEILDSLSVAALWKARFMGLGL